MCTHMCSFMVHEHAYMCTYSFQTINRTHRSSSAIKTDIHFNANSEDVVFINESIQEDLLSKSTSNNGMQLNLYEDDNKDV